MVSVIVPVYNSELYLEETVTSIRNQTYSNLQILLVDGCSMDNSLEICEKYKKLDNRIQIIKHDKNYGPERARNDGILNSTGEWFMFVDSDDLLPADSIENLVKMGKFGKADIVFAGFEEVSLRGETNYIVPDALEGKYNRHDFVDLFLSQLSVPILSCVGSKLYRTNIIKSNKIYVDIKCRHNADLAFTMDAVRICDRFVILKKSVYRYIKRENSMMNSYRDGVFESVSLARNKLAQVLKKEGLFEKKKSLYYEVKIETLLIAINNAYIYGKDIRNAVKTAIADNDTVDAVNYTIIHSHSMSIRIFLLMVKFKMGIVLKFAIKLHKLKL